MFLATTYFNKNEFSFYFMFGRPNQIRSNESLVIKSSLCIIQIDLPIHYPNYCAVTCNSTEPQRHQTVHNH